MVTKQINRDSKYFKNLEFYNVLRAKAKQADEPIPDVPLCPIHNEMAKVRGVPDHSSSNTLTGFATFHFEVDGCCNDAIDEAIRFIQNFVAEKKN